MTTNGSVRTSRDDADLSLAADLAFSVEVPGRRPVHGHLAGSGRRLRLAVDDPSAFAGRRDSAGVRAFADALSRRDLTVTVTSGDAELLTLGAIRSSWWQRRITGSRHMRVGGGKGAWTAVRARSRGSSGPGLLPDAGLAPPPTLFPMAPTFLRRPAHVTTTHAAFGGGDPRLVLASPEGDWLGRQPAFRLRRDVVTIGSDEQCNVCLPGLEPVHAEVHHDEDDEFFVVATGGDVRVNGERVPRQLLRTASRVGVGPWTLTFYREEYADHGRPYGGRVGGEVGHQRPQPPRHRMATPEAGYGAACDS
jgi:hypothetical protein